jgi:putative SOS response-associated peptidase YedK
MCGRYELNATSADLQNHFGNLLPSGAWERFASFASYNIAPSQIVPVIRYSKRDENNVIDRLTWGFRPGWSSKAWINARADNLFATNAFREGAAKRRCLVPATGWYEWQVTQTKRKQPYYMHFDRVFAFAGIWSARKLNEVDWQLNFAIVTTDARGLAEKVHDRMPLVMHPRHYAAWLAPKTNNAETLLEPFDNGSLRVYPISTLVNDPKNDSAAVLEPLQTAMDSKGSEA